MPLRTRAWLFGLPAIVCAAWTVLAGKDVNWDLLNYHYYLPLELLEGRLQQDYFAASTQSYLNPIGYLPFYFMVSSGWHSVAASIVLALAHSLSIGTLYLLAWRLFGHREQRERVVLSCLAAALGAASAVFWPMVGTSFLDPLLVPPMLAGLVLLVDGRRFALAGALFGIAAALKYSNAAFALAALPLALLGGVRAGAAYAAGGALAVAVLAGPWLALMMREFGNPVFPMLNAWFQSPEAPAGAMLSERFALPDAAAALAFPFRMALLDRSLYAETFAPDLRFAALAAAAAAAAVPWLSRRGRASALRSADWRVLGFFALAALLWLLTSANGRYGLVVLLLSGVCLARLVDRLLPPAGARIALALLLALQLGAAAVAVHARWFIAEPWSRHWLPYAVPERALREPALYLTLESLTLSVLAPFVHPDSAFVNLRGQHSLPPDAPRLAALLERHRGQVRVLGRSLELAGGAPPPSEVKAYDDTLVRIGYRIDSADCFTIEWRPAVEDVVSRAANWLSRTPPANETLSAVSCALRPAQRDPAHAEAERRAAALFDRIEKACPSVFRGHTAVTEPLGGGWSRHYVGLDARLEAVGERIVLQRYRAGTHVDLGRQADWQGAGAALPPACR